MLTARGSGASSSEVHVRTVQRFLPWSKACGLQTVAPASRNSGFHHAMLLAVQLPLKCETRESRECPVQHRRIVRAGSAGTRSGPPLAQPPASAVQFQDCVKQGWILCSLPLLTLFGSSLGSTGSCTTGRRLRECLLLLTCLQPSRA